MYFNFPSSISAKFLPQTPRKNPLSEKKDPLSEVKFSTSEVNQPFFLPKKRRETQCLGLSPLFWRKDTTFSTEIQIALTFRNNPPIVNLQRFAAASLRDVLYYEAGFGRERPTVSLVVVRPGFNGNLVPKVKGVT